MADIYTRAQQFGYINARLRAARPQLIDSATLGAMCEVESVEAMIELLLPTAYGPYIESLRTRYSGALLVSRAVMERFSKKVAQIEGMIKNNRKRPLLYAATGQLELYNLRLLFLEAMEGGDYSSEYVQVGSISGKRLERMRAAKDIDLLKKIASEMGYTISTDSTRYAQIVDDMERAYYKRIAELKALCDDEPELRICLEKMIDYKNFDLAVRALKFGSTVKYIAGGEVPIDKTKKAVGEGMEALVKVYGLEKVYEKSKGDLSWTEELYDREIMLWITKASVANPFSMAGVIGFIGRLDIERRNLRSIVVSKGVLKPEEIKSKLIW